MSQQYLRLNKKKELEAQLKQAKYTLVKEKARCFKILNDSEPFIPKCGKEAQKILEEFNNLCEYYGIDPDSFKMETSSPSPEIESPQKNSPAKKTPKKASDRTPSKSVPKSPSNKDDSGNQFSQAFRSRMQILNKEENEKKAILDELNKKLLLLNKQNDDLNNQKNIKIVTIDKSFSVLKDQVNGLRDYFTNFNNEIKSKINKSKRLINKVIETKKNKNQEQLNKLDAIVNQLQNQKKSIEREHDEKIAKLSIQQVTDQNFTYTYKNGKLKEIVLRIANEVQKKFDERLKSSPLKKITDNISKKIDQLNKKIGLLEKKLNDYREKRAQRASATINHNWGILISSFSKIGPYNEAIDEYIKELQEEDNEITNQLNAEL